MLMARQLANPFPPYVLIVVVCWASALFLGNGLVATPNAVTVCAHLAGAIAVGSAIFLMLELSHPYTGVVRLSSAGAKGLSMSIKLTDKQLMMLSAAAQRNDRCLVAAPNLKVAAAQKVASSPEFTIAGWRKTQFIRRDAARVEADAAALRAAGLPTGRGSFH